MLCWGRFLSEARLQMLGPVLLHPVLQLLVPQIPHHGAVTFVWNVFVAYDISDFARQNAELSRSVIQCSPRGYHFWEEKTGTPGDCVKDTGMCGNLLFDKNEPHQGIKSSFQMFPRWLSEQSHNCACTYNLPETSSPCSCNYSALHYFPPYPGETIHHP